MYKLVPQLGFVTVIPLKASETKVYTGKLLSDVETTGMDVLQYGRIVSGGKSKYSNGDVVLYPKLASDKTNFGDPRQVIVEEQHIKAFLQEIQS